MEIDEEILLTKSGKKNPFTIPDGYFEHFTSQLMDSLPDPKEKKIPSPAPKHNFYIYCAAAAACIVVFVALFCVSFFKENRPIANSAAVLKEHHDAEDRTFDRIADYTMMDNEDIYASVADH